MRSGLLQRPPSHYVIAMLFWILIFSLAGVVVVLLVLALLRQRGDSRTRSDYDIAVYRDQLAGVEQDLARGVLTSDVADRTRVEISRRILEADRAREAETAARAPLGWSYAMAGLVGLFLIGGSVAAYQRLGAPGYDDLPLKARLEASERLYATRPGQEVAELQAEAQMPPAPEIDAEFAGLMDRLRAALAERPDDTTGLQLLARNEASLGNFKAAHQAQARLLALLGDAATASAYADYADLLVIAAGGYVSPEAEAALTQAMQRDPQNGTARYYSGLMFAQTGRADLAFQIWNRLLQGSAPDDPWVPIVRDQIEEAAYRAGINYTLPPLAGTGLSGPSAADMEAASEMSAQDRMDMIRGMVASLSERLATEGGTPAEWARLIGALGVLGETEQAQAILQEARAVFAGNEPALADLARTAAQAGLTE